MGGRPPRYSVNPIPALHESRSFLARSIIVLNYPLCRALSGRQRTLREA